MFGWKSHPTATRNGVGDASSLTQILDGVKMVFFDFGDTLAYRARPIFEIWQEIAAERGIILSEEALVEARTAADAFYGPQVYEFKGRMNEFWDLYHKCILERLEIADPNGSLLRAVNSALPSTTKWYELFPESLHVISTLKERGCGVGIVTNSTEGILERLKNLGLNEYLDTVVCSQEAGAEKPDPAPFILALRRSGRSAGECIFVGDSPEADIQGARSVGIEAILIDRKGKYPKAGCTTIRNLKELLD
jgi:putative hydrolase of the HAD superfamily